MVTTRNILKLDIFDLGFFILLFGMLVGGNLYQALEVEELVKEKVRYLEEYSELLGRAGTVIQHQNEHIQRMEVICDEYKTSSK